MSGGRDIKLYSGDCWGQPHAVIPTIKDGVELPDEDIPEDPEGSSWRLDFKSFKASAADLHAVHEVLWVEKGVRGMQRRREERHLEAVLSVGSGQH